MKKGIIFDLDGTLWNSAEGVLKSWNEVIETLPDKDHIVTMEEMFSLMGKPMDEIGALVFPNMSLPRRNEVMEICCKRENDYLLQVGGILYPALEETLKTLGETYELYIVSNCQVGYIEAFLGHYHFEKYFKDTECFGNTNRMKADNIKLVVDRNKLDQAVYVGDTLGDYKATMEAGLPFIHAAYGFGKVDEAEYKAEEFSMLPDMISKILG